MWLGWSFWITADGEAEEFVKVAHPLAVTSGEVVIHGDDVHAAAGEGIEEDGQRADERLPFTGGHFGDHAAMQGDAADELHIESGPCSTSAAWSQTMISRPQRRRAAFFTTA
jgi:hypothetical protein